MGTLSGKVSRVKYTASSPVTSTGEPCTRTTGTTGPGYVQIDSTARRHWDRNSTGFVLYLDGTAVGSSNYQINHVLGRFEWLTGDPSTGSTGVAHTYTADVQYVTASYLPGANSWTVDVETALEDDTTFSTTTADLQWRTFVPTLSQASVEISRYVDDRSTVQPIFFDRLNAEQDVIVELWLESTQSGKWEGYAWVDSDAFETPVDGLESETVGLQVDDQLHFSTR